MAEPSAQAADSGFTNVLIGAVLIALGLVLAAHLAGFGTELSAVFGTETADGQPPPKFFNDDLIGRLLGSLGRVIGDALQSALGFLGAHFGAKSFGGLGPLVPALPFWLIGLRLVLR